MLGRTETYICRLPYQEPFPLSLAVIVERQKRFRVHLTTPPFLDLNGHQPITEVEGHRALRRATVRVRFAVPTVGLDGVEVSLGHVVIANGTDDVTVAVAGADGQL